MKKNNCAIIIIFIVFAIVSISCKKNATEPDEEIPLDGRGGGVISYCYQPLQAQDGRHQIYAINADGTGNKKLIEATIGLNHHDWSPDGQKFVCVGYLGSNYQTWSIHTFNFDGTNLTRLTRVSGVWDTEPAWSPDGTRIAFTRIYPNDGNREELWIMDTDGSNQHYIGIEGFGARWSVDGTRFLYSVKINGIYDLFSCQTDGTDIERLTETNAHEMYASWSPNGQSITFSEFSDEFNSSNIFIMDSDGSNQVGITDSNNSDSFSRFSSDGSLISFIRGSLAEGQIDVFAINRDGSNLRQVTDLPTGITAINPVWKP